MSVMLPIHPYQRAMPGMMCVGQPGSPGAVSCAHYDSTSGPELVSPDWLSFLPDDLPLAHISIPGTHNSLAQYGTMDMVTQTWDLSTQLNAGIRYLDLRVRASRTTTEIHVFRDRQYQNMSLQDALLWVSKYLEEHPGEVILIRIRLDRERNPDKIQRNKMVPKEVGKQQKEQVVMDLAVENQRLFEGVKNLVDDGMLFAPYNLNVTNANILLGQARGKFIIVQDFEGPMGTLNYDDNFEVVDPYIIESLSDSSVKKRRKIITDHVKKASKASSKEKYFLTYTSADGEPYSGIHPYRAAVEINAEVLDFLQKRQREDIKKLGIIAMDFPGQMVISAIIQRNFAKKRKWNKKKKQFVFE